MKVILLKDVVKVGKKDQLVDVADGYGRNYLIRNKLAVEATSRSLEILEKQKAAVRSHQEELRQDALKLAEKLKNVTVDFKVKVGKEGKPFGSISTKAVVEKLELDHHIAVDKRKIQDAHPISSLGLNPISIELYPGVMGTITVRLREE